MLNQFKSKIQSIGIDSDTKIYLAISGGVDSMVLSQLLIQAQIPHTLLHCNFKLRGLESDEDEKFVIDYAKHNNLEFHIKAFETEQLATDLKLTTQECARKLRYDWFFTFLNDTHAKLLTAHHLDDSIETFFINVLRGTGLKGLTGIPSGEQNIYRPLLSFTKTEVLNYANINHIVYREDSSNTSNHYLRNKLRHHLIPDLKDLTRNFESKMDTLFTELNETQQFLDLFLSKYTTELKSLNQIKISELNTIPQFMWHKVFAHFGLSRIHNNELIKLTESQTGSVFKNSTHVLLNDRGSILVQPITKTAQITITIPEDSTIVKTNNGELSFEIITDPKHVNFKNTRAYLDFNLIQWPLILRQWEIGDKIIPLGFKSNKLISKVLVDKKQNKFQKENQYVIESNGEIIWLVDLMVSNPFSITDQTTKIIKIEHIQY